MSAFHIAAKNNRVGVVRELMEICPDVSKQLNNNGQMSLRVVVLGQKRKVVQYLLTSSRFGLKGHVNMQDKDENTPLHLATTRKDNAISKCFMKERTMVDGSPVNKHGKIALDIKVQITFLRG